MIKVAAVTFAYKSYDFLRKWVAHYGPVVGGENLYIVSHGPDPMHREIGAGCNVVSVPRKMSENFDLERWSFLSQFSSGLLAFYDRVVCGDCDELLLVDPRFKQSLLHVLAETDAGAVAPHAYHALPDIETMASFNGADWERPISEQLTFLAPDARYCKPCILSKPGRFLPGGHGMQSGDFLLKRKLLMVHLKFASSARLNDLATELSDELKSSDAKVNGKMAYAWKAGADAEKAHLIKLASMPMFKGTDPLRTSFNGMSRSKVKVDGGVAMNITPEKLLYRFKVPPELVGLY